MWLSDLLIIRRAKSLNIVLILWCERVGPERPTSNDGKPCKNYGILRKNCRKANHLPSWAGGWVRFR